MAKRSLVSTVAVVVVVVACGQAILTAPQNSLLDMSANPSFVMANGGVSVVSVLVTEPAGTPVADGTVVQFFTDLGHIDEQGKTNDGVVRVNFTSDSRSGTATVTAFSGGVRPSSSPSGGTGSSPSPSPSSSPGASPTPAPSPSPTRNPGPGASPRGGLANLGTGTGVGTASITIAVGSALPQRVILEAIPDRIVFPRSSLIRGFVLDANSNPVQGVPVFFSILQGGATESLESGGRPVYSDANGFVADVLDTSAPATAPSTRVTVQVATPNDKRFSITVQIN